MTCTVLALGIAVDTEHRVRADRILRAEPAVWRAVRTVESAVVVLVRRAWAWAVCCAGRDGGDGTGGRGEREREGERRGLLEGAE
jgi:hypothetical protein